jgi:hypothetical protein
LAHRACSYRKCVNECAQSIHLGVIRHASNREYKVGVMTHPLAINHVLDRLAELDGMPIELEGILAAEPEGYQLLHYPKSERRPAYKDGGRSYPPIVVLTFGNGGMQPNESALTRWLGKRVRIHGMLHYDQTNDLATCGTTTALGTFPLRRSNMSR